MPIKRSQVAAARLVLAAARYQGKEAEVPETTKRLAALDYRDLEGEEDANEG